MKPVFFCVNTYILFVLKPKSYSLLTLTLQKTCILRTASFSYVSENQLRCTPSNYAGVCLQNIYDYSPFGVSLDGRTMESDFYRRGFNGMEKDDEFKGKGNSYTTEFRQLDPRVGRWFSIDPVTKPTFGSYNSMSNNPIIRIDPWGNDDYFNLAGVYLGSSKDGHTIRIVTSDVKLKKAIKNTTEFTKVLSDFSYCEEDQSNCSMLSAIASFYAPFSGINETVLVKEKENGGVEGVAAFYQPCKIGSAPCDDDYFAIAVSSEGLINNTLNDAANLTNSLSHEKNHQDNYDTRFPLEHVNSIIAQSNHPTWKVTTNSFKRSAVKYAQTLLNQSIKNSVDLNKINDKIQEFNSSPAGEKGELIYNKETNEVNYLRKN